MGLMMIFRFRGKDSLYNPLKKIKSVNRGFI
ncbi:hypothetical protein NTHI1209_01256 [Haemophilus influenzae]|uniref:Uncharacterized protein n=1 Tax=Haemophilus influenzae TaxID=727 RepID=A0A158SXQ5_HAEIF|nr:hypothetical protein NTHI1209_01256 [Haemophilus influenzae]